MKNILITYLLFLLVATACQNEEKNLSELRNVLLERKKSQEKTPISSIDSCKEVLESKDILITDLNKSVNKLFIINDSLESIANQKYIEKSIIFVVRHPIGKKVTNKLFGHFLYVKNNIYYDVKSIVKNYLINNLLLTVYSGGKRIGIIEYGDQKDYDEYISIFNIITLDESSEYIKNLTPYYDMIGIASSNHVYKQNYYSRRIGTLKEKEEFKKIAYKNLKENINGSFSLDSMNVIKFSVVDDNRNTNSLLIGNVTSSQTIKLEENQYGVFLIIDYNSKNMKKTLYSLFSDYRAGEGSHFEEFVDVFDVDFDGEYEIIIEANYYESSDLKILKKLNDKWEVIHKITEVSD